MPLGPPPSSQAAAAAAAGGAALDSLLGSVELVLYGLSWYVSSAVCNTSARKLLTVAGFPLWLCVSQFACAWAVLAGYFWWRPELRVGVPREAQGEMNRLAVAYTLGFVFVNAGYIAVNVSLAETLRSAEPLFSVLFAKLWLRDEHVSGRTALTLVPIVLGGVLSSGGDASFNAFGLVFVSLSNTCFALRSIFTKKLKRVHSADAINVFFDITRLGLAWLVVSALAWDFVAWATALESPDSSSSSPPTFLAPRGHLQAILSSPMRAWFVNVALVNGLSYFLYNQMSFIVLSRVSVVSHAVGNSFRRVVTILASVWYFGNPINPQNALGITLAIVGVVMYSMSRARDEAQVQLQQG